MFEAGRTYKVNVKGSSPTTGAKTFWCKLPADSILFDDDIGNGFDLNATLKITRINNITTNSGRGVNPMAFAMRIRSDFAEQVKVISLDPGIRTQWVLHSLLMLHLQLFHKNLL